MHTDHRVHRQRESDFKNLKICIDSSQKGAKGPDDSTFILQSSGGASFRSGFKYMSI